MTRRSDGVFVVLRLADGSALGRIVDLIAAARHLQSLEVVPRGADPVGECVLDETVLLVLGLASGDRFEVEGAVLLSPWASPLQGGRDLMVTRVWTRPSAPLATAHRAVALSFDLVTGTRRGVLPAVCHEIAIPASAEDRARMLRELERPRWIEDSSGVEVAMLLGEVASAIRRADQFVTSHGEGVQLQRPPHRRQWRWADGGWVLEETAETPCSGAS